MTSIAVLGVGSPFGSDTLGWRVIDCLQRQSDNLDETVLLAKLDRPGMDLIRWMNDYERLLVVDALLAEAPEGQVLCIEGSALDQLRTPASSHALGVAAAIALARALGSRAVVKVVGAVVMTNADAPSDEVVTACAARVVECLAGVQDIAPETMR